MPRYKRLFLTHIPLHIVQRGHNRNVIFAEPADYQYYMANLIEAKSTYSIELYAYCLMTNHVHLLIAPTSDECNVSGFMRLLSARQTRYVNKLERRSGTLWEGRFKSSLIDTERYLLACSRYIDLNPVRAGMVATPQEYPWSSYRGLAGISINNALDMHPVYLALGRICKKRFKAYSSLVANRYSNDELDFLRTAIRRNQVTGSAKFAEQLSIKCGRRLSTAAQGRPRKVK